MHEQPGPVRVGDQRGGRDLRDLGQGALVGRRLERDDRVRHDLRLPGADAIGIGGDLGQAGRRQHGAEEARIASQRPAVGPAVDEGVGVVGDVDHLAGPEVDVVAVDQLDRPRLHAGRAQVFQAGRIEALHQDRRVLAVEVVGPHHLQDRVLERMTAGRAAAVGDRLGIVPVRVLALRVDRERAPERGALRPGDVDDLLEAEDRQLAVEIGRPLGAGVVGGAGDPPLELGQREVGDGPVVGVVLAIDHQRSQDRLRIVRVGQVAEVARRTVRGDRRVLDVDQHAGRGALAARHLGIAGRHLGDVGVVPEPGVVARHRDAVLRQVDVEFERVRAGIRRRLVGRARLLGIQARKAAVADDQWRVAVQGLEWREGVAATTTITTAAGAR